jgi:predicted helicase
MPTDHRDELKEIRTFPSLVRYLRDEMGWPIQQESFEDVDDLFYDFTPEELGLDAGTAAKIESIKRLRPLSTGQPWGIYFVKFEPKRLPVVALRRILSRVALKKRASDNRSDMPSWQANDLLFVSNYGDQEQRCITFAHFTQHDEKDDLPTLKVLGWDNSDTPLHLDDVADKLRSKLRWPDDPENLAMWRDSWRSAFTLEHREVITTSKALAVRLAELARAIRDRIRTVLSIEAENGRVTRLMKAFQEALVHDLDESGFADMYAQTISYGLLSARITNPKANTADGFAAQLPVTNPFLKELMETFLHVGGRKRKAGRGPGIDFDELGVSEVVELLDDANMEAVVRDFGDKNPQEDPVIHFYELFLKEYDKKQKVSRGVFYTPRPVVSYIVCSVHELLQTEFGLVDGLADTTTWGEMARRHNDLTIPEGTSPEQAFVQILDPATGTGTFLVEVIDLIHKMLVAKWKAQDHGEKKIEVLWNDYVPKHLLPRLHGYELLMAPYAIAHLKIGLKLHETGYRFESDERARIYLTNALEPPSDIGQQELAGILPALAHEAQAVNEIKRKQRFTVVLGNPPYSKSSQNQGRWIRDLMEEYKQTVRTAETQIQALSDDYSKFLRLGHFTLEQSRLGLLGFITNNGYLDGPLFRDMRNSLLRFFGSIRILNLHGDSRKRFSPPEGKADENVFDIQQGVAISVFWKDQVAEAQRTIGYAELWGNRQKRYEALLDRPAKRDEVEQLKPEPPFFLFIPVERNLEAEFHSGWHLYDVFGTGNRESDNHESYGAGFVTQQDKFAVGFTAEDVADNVREFLDPKARDEALWERFEFCSTNQWDFKRAKMELKDLDLKSLTRRCLYRPFDYRYTVLDRNICTILRKRITSQFEAPNLGLLMTRRVTRLPFNNVFVTNHCAEYKVASHDRNTIVFPLWIRAYDQTCSPGLFGKNRRQNLSSEFLRAIAERLRLTQERQGGCWRDLAPEEIFHYAYAVFYSPGYRSRYAEFLKIDFPRLPLPGSLDLLRDLARLGGELVALHLMESPKLAHFVTTYTGQKNPEVGRVGWSNDTVWLDASTTKKGHPAVLGTIGFRGVPEAVWNFYIGGYQVCEKWLKDRKGRALSEDDIAHYQKIIIALSETIRMMRKIDEVIDAHGGWPEAFASESIAEREPEGLPKAAEPQAEYNAHKNRKKQ